MGRSKQTARKQNDGKKSSGKSNTKEAPAQDEEQERQETTKTSPKKESQNYKNGKKKSTKSTESNTNNVNASTQENKKNDDTPQDDDDKFLQKDNPKKVVALTPKTYEKKHRGRTLAPSPSAFTPYSLPTDTSPQKKKRRNVVDLKEADEEQDNSDLWFQGLVSSIKTPTKKSKVENDTKDENNNNIEEKEPSSQSKTPDFSKKKSKTPTKEPSDNAQPQQAENEANSQISKEQEERASQEIQNAKQFYAEVDKMELSMLNTTPIRRTATPTPPFGRTNSFTRRSPASPTSSQASQSSQEYPRLRRSSSVTVPPTPPNTQDVLFDPIPPA